MIDERKPEVAVVGGSLGGLFAAIALKETGCRVSVYEQSSGSMSSRGGGIVVQQDLIDFFDKYGIDDLPLPQTSCRARRIFNQDGTIRSDQSPAQSFTSWDAIFRKLKAMFPVENYHPGRRVAEFGQGDDFNAIELEDGSEISADLIVCSEGSSSVARAQLLPAVDPFYAGYVAWRGYVDEATLSAEVLDAINDRFCFLPLSDGHILTYPIPGKDGATEAGSRRFNWVWYVDVPDQDELKAMLTDKDGRERAAAVSPGKTAASVIQSLHEKAEKELPGPLRELVMATPAPFLQAIYDVVIPTGVFGRTCLLGDAGFVVRPHTAAATAKAAAEAMNLAAQLEENDFEITTALASFDQFQQQIGQQLHHHGVSLGQH